jgi:hypothetical protein
MRGHSVMVAILATIGRFKLRTTGRAVMSLTVKEACGMASTSGSDFLTGRHFSPADANVNSLMSIL